MIIDPSHPRAFSLKTREKLVWGVKKGITSLAGLIAHGRGEAFDYLLGEKTHDFAYTAIKASAALLLLAKHPVICLNGNTAILVPKESVELSDLLKAKLEVNLFHPSKFREKKIATYLKSFRAKEVLLPDKLILSGIESNRRIISLEGQAKADVVFVPLEDGDRTSALIAQGKKVITVDLNPLSRTAQTATITIVDNIIRTMPLLIKTTKELKNTSRKTLLSIVNNYNNSYILSCALTSITSRLKEIAEKSK